MTVLSVVRPDRDDLVSQLVSALELKNTWKDKITSSTGQTLIDFIAAIGAYSQYSIEASYREVWPESATNKSSIYAASNFAGVRINRKRPATIEASLTYTGPTTVPPYTQFVAGGTYWFNRQALTLGVSPTTVSLYQGRITTVNTKGLGTDFSAFVSTEDNFSVSDVDVQVDINNVAIPVRIKGLWTAQGVPGAHQFTTPNGELIVLFGNDLYGSKPGVNDDITVRYAVTFGADGNNLPVFGQKIYQDTDANVNGTITLAPNSGANETDYTYYKSITPGLFGAFDSVSTPQQYKKLPLTFPGVLDAMLFAQREINPKALTWMNNIKVVLLTSTPWSTGTWNTFTAYMQEKSAYKAVFICQDPVATPVNVSVDVYCANYANLTDIRAKVIAKVTALFSPRPGILGFDFYRFDIERTVKSADQNIEYLVLQQPTTDLILSTLNVAAPTVTRTAGGTLAAGTYDYAISVVSTLGGETAPANWTTLTSALGSNTFNLAWAAVPNAASYKVWGRQTGGALGLLGTVAAVGPLTFVDNGSIAPSGTVPAEATISTYYGQLGTLTVNTYFSTRELKIED